MNNTIRPDVTRQEVAATMEKLRADGKNPSVKKIVAIIGGSDATIARFKREILAEEAPPLDSEKAREAYRIVWAEALRAGAEQSAKALEDLNQDYQSVLDENDRLSGQLATLETHFKEHERRREGRPAGI